MRSHLATRAVVSLVVLFVLAGSSAAAVPAPTTETRLFLRYDDAAGTDCGGRYLSRNDGPDGAGEDCQSHTAATTFAGQTSTQEWVTDARTRLPITLDASRTLTGAFTIETMLSGSDRSQPNWVEMDVAVTLNATVLPTARLSSGGIYRESQKKLTFSIDVPDSLDDVEVTAARIRVTWKRVVHVPGAHHASISMDDPASFIALHSAAG